MLAAVRMGMLAEGKRQTATVEAWNGAVERALTEYGKMSAKEVLVAFTS